MGAGPNLRAEAHRLGPTVRNDDGSGMTNTPIETPAQRLRRGIVYLLGGLPLGIAAYVVAITGFTVGTGIAVLWLGLPILVGTLYSR